MKYFFMAGAVFLLYSCSSHYNAKLGGKQKGAPNKNDGYHATLANKVIDHNVKNKNKRDRQKKKELKKQDETLNEVNKNVNKKKKPIATPFR